MTDLASTDAGGAPPPPRWWIVAGLVVFFVAVIVVAQVVTDVPLGGVVVLGAPLVLTFGLAALADAATLAKSRLAISLGGLAVAVLASPGTAILIVVAGTLGAVLAVPAVGRAVRDPSGRLGLAVAALVVSAGLRALGVLGIR